MSKLQPPRHELQHLLDQISNLHGDISLIDQEIEKYEDFILGEGWTEGNIKVGWTKGDAFSNKMNTHLLNRDRLFSLSSITSPASIHLGPIQNEKTLPNEGSRFYKRKKKKKLLKGRRPLCSPGRPHHHRKRGRPRKYRRT